MIRRFIRWLNTPNELRWGETPHRTTHANKPTLAAAIQRALSRD